ncbi:hemerythrin domain-containing protein [Palleronia rufa]|uniref:hemerythrin domain-containing protein n=2 Tax=Palleronia rufa TaxID=1530186 RepID=UPI001F3B48A3|nr:hemerythrin domain-containing protein [Palleronia rufa]
MQIVLIHDAPAAQVVLQIRKRAALIIGEGKSEKGAHAAQIVAPADARKGDDRPRPAYLRGMDDDALTLERRTGLPDALRVLETALPRGTWEAHPGFSPLTRFWLQRHLTFREILSNLKAGTDAYLNGDTDPRRYGRETARLARIFVQELHGHHTIEDQHYFPMLQTLDGRLDRGFALLDADHDALDGHLVALADATDAMRAGLGSDDPLSPAAMLGRHLDGFERYLNRHLTDEEDLVVPVILTYAPEIG